MQEARSLDVEEAIASLAFGSVFRKPWIMVGIVASETVFMATRTDKALFNRKVLNTAIAHYGFPADLEARYQKILAWVESLEAGTLYQVKETALHGQFLRDVFQEVLGYRSMIEGGGKTWEIAAEETIANGGGSADGALGFFSGKETTKGKVKLEGQVIAPIELKGAKADLDRQKAGESPVDQGWRYANHTAGCRWVLVSNYREIRLYQTSKSTAYYEAFFLEELADLEAFKRFYFVLCRQNFLPFKAGLDQVSRIDQVLKASDLRQEEVTDELYAEYKNIRELLVNDFIRTQTTGANQELILIEKAQKLLDRILFIAFCEDQGLLPKETLKNAHDARSAYTSESIWEIYKRLFRWVDKGNEEPAIAGYNGGLFAYDSILDGQLTVPDSRCTRLKNLARFEFDTEVSADILGRIFEQSITDLEELKAEKTGQTFDEKKGKRKTQGVYYTPAWVTQYMVATALGGYLQRREQEIRDRFTPKELNTKVGEIRFWQTVRDEALKPVRVIDPACGSGAFLIAAFDYLLRSHDRLNRQLAALGSATENLAAIDRWILTENLFGVDLSPESVEITKLSLWLKTAAPGKTLTDLDNNIKFGNSIVDDRNWDVNAFPWESQFPQVFAADGFDVAIGNPPYVRQEFLSHVKPFLQQHYASYDGVADLYTYFYEKGLKILKPNGLLSYIVTNKWLRSGYGEGLRRFFTQNSVFEQIIDFGHAPIFQDADTFPCIVVARKSLNSGQKLEEKADESEQKQVIICPVPREQLSNINLAEYVEEQAYQVPWSRFNADAWSLERSDVDDLMRKIQQVGIPLRELIEVKPLRGIVTGLNEAFLIDETTKNYLVQADPKCAEIIKPYLRGQDIGRWIPEWKNLWMILATQKIDIEQYASVKAYLEQFRKKLEARAGNQLWWQIQGKLAAYEIFEQPKIVYQEIQFHPAYSFDSSNYFTNNKGFILATADLYVLAALNSPLMWWHNWRYLPHMKDDALTPAGYVMENLPIAPPTDDIRSQVEPIVSRLIEITKANQDSYRDVLNWLRSRFRIEKPGQKLETFATLTLQEMHDEVRKRIPKAGSKSSDRLGIAGQKEVTQAYNDYALPIQTRTTEAQTLEHRLSDLINQAYGLTDEEINLMWKTAPPRMPIGRQPNPTVK
ncbi:Eco57I restriction-modification methylase domain-containing protein [Myxacorys almedinensis]